MVLHEPQPSTLTDAVPGSTSGQPLLTADDVTRVVDRMAHQLIERAAGSTTTGDGLADLVLVGIPTRGAPLARRLAARIEAFTGTAVDVGTVDITLYRDDLRTRGVRALEDTRLPDAGIDGRLVVLVDDVLFSGRSVRAALDGLRDVGRPRAVQLAVLVDRGHRELPIKADFVGKNVPTSRTQQVRVRLAEVDGEDGVTVVNLFFEDSTRTRISFELAAKRLSADVINFSAKGSSVSKGESLKDTALTLEAMGADGIVVRHGSSGAPHRLATWVAGSVVNAGDGIHEHPTQALLDAYTIRQRLGRLEGVKVVITGDVLHSRVARSNVWLLHTLGAEVTLVAPPTLLPVGVGSWPVTVSYDLDAVLPQADVVMMLRVQAERMNASFFPSAREYSRRYGLDATRMAKLGDDAIVMHPGPMNRGMEIAADVADSPRSTIVEQVGNGVSVRMAVLYLLLGGPA
jgi:aspartate carbamoyltransferase catalytic subunit